MLLALIYVRLSFYNSDYVTAATQASSRSLLRHSSCLNGIGHCNCIASASTWLITATVLVAGAYPMPEHADLSTQAVSTHVVKDSPHPQEPFEFGLLKVNSDLHKRKKGRS